MTRAQHTCAYVAPEGGGGELGATRSLESSVAPSGGWPRLSVRVSSLPTVPLRCTVGFIPPPLSGAEEPVPERRTGSPELELPELARDCPARLVGQGQGKLAGVETVCGRPGQPKSVMMGASRWPPARCPRCQLCPKVSSLWEGRGEGRSGNESPSSSSRPGELRDHHPTPPLAELHHCPPFEGLLPECHTFASLRIEHEEISSVRGADLVRFGPPHARWVLLQSRMETSGILPLYG